MKQVRDEKRRTQAVISEVKVALNRVLQEEHNKKLYVSSKDSYRLLALRNWSQKYKVTLSYIVSTLLEHYSSWTRKYQTKSGKAKGIGIRIATLCGKHSEAYLVERIKKDFPEQENIQAWQHEKQDRLFQQRCGDEIIPTGKTVLQYPTIGAYVRKYRARIKESRKEFDKFVRDPQNVRRHYRNNPFV